MSLLLILLQAAAPVQPADAPNIRCAFETAAAMAVESSDPPERVADRVVASCAAVGGPETPPMSDTGRLRIRAAAIAMVNRKRGTDGQPADAPIRIPTVESSLTIPDEIAPAVIPYFICLSASAGIPVLTEGGGRRIAPPPGLGKGSDCSEARKSAARNADGMLVRQGGRSPAQRRALIESTLEAIDAHQKASSSRKSEDEPHAAR
jgi:hypothetical protein